MSFLETVERARAFLERNGRVSLRALQREFNLDDDALDELIEELVEIQRVAVRDGRALAWAGEVPPAPTEPPARERDPRDYTPKHLADKILQSKSALEGERKQVTVLFADVKGSLELAEQVDPEEWHRILDRFFQILADGVHRFEGTVNQYTGDGIMALFGAPIAHEDHARRSCWAALWLRDELRRYADELRVDRGLSFSTRVGINSGEVVVGKIGNDLRMDYTAQGQTVGLAARMEELAEPGKVLLTGRTAKLVSGYFELRSLGESQIKGLSERIELFELEGAGRLRTRLDVSQARGFSKFVGRTDEMQTLELAFNQAAEGNGQVVGVVGQAGVGKSRLCLEFLERCRARDIRVLEAHCPSHGKTVPLLPILELLRNAFGIAVQDRVQVVREKIAGRLLLLGLASDQVLPLVFDFLGVPDPEQPPLQMDPEERQRQLYSFLKRLVQARSEREATVLLFDDIQWIDSGSDAFLAQLVEATSATRTMLLVNFRPEYHARWIGNSYYHQLPLSPLGSEAIEEMLGELLGDDPILAELRDLIRDRTGGNPFFIEEVVLSLVESGALEGPPGRYQLAASVDRLEVPPTVQSVLAARIDRLPEREKRLLQTAAVIGRELPEPILRTVAQLPRHELTDALSTLKAAEFIYERSLYPEAQYTFKHPLTVEVAYGAQLSEQRTRVHAAVARALEEYHCDALDQNAALLAHHLQKAGEDSAAAHWHARSARWVKFTDPVEAHRHWLEVRGLLRGVPSSEDAVELVLEAAEELLWFGFSAGLPEKEADAVLAEGLRLARDREDVRAIAMLEGNYAHLKGFHNRLEESLNHVQSALSVASSLDDALLEARLQMVHARVLLLTGRFSQGQEVIDATLERLGESPRIGDDPDRLYRYLILLLYRADFLTLMGEPREGAEVFDKAIQRARESGLVVMEGILCREAVNTHFFLGSTAKALDLSGRAVAIAESFKGAWDLVLSYFMRGQAQILNEEWAAAIDDLERSLSVMRETGIGLEGEHFVLPRLAEAHLGAGNLEAALDAAEQGIAAVERSPHLKGFAPPVHLVFARVLLATMNKSARDVVEEKLRTTTELIQETGGAVYLPGTHEVRAELDRVLGDDASRQRELREAHRLYTEMGATGHAERLARELGL